MYRIVLVLTILAVLVYYYRLYCRNPALWNVLLKDFRMYTEQIRLVFSRQPDAPKRMVFKRLRRAFLSATGILFLVMAVTGFIPVLLYGAHLSGWMLILHVTAAPFFAVCLAMTALFYANAKQFEPADLGFMKSRFRETAPGETVRFWSRISFWLFLLVSVPAVLSVILSMYPLFGTGGQHTLLGLHQYSVLILFIIVAVFMAKRPGVKVKQ